MKRDAAKVRTIPAWGVIKGGRLDGWRFHFLGFDASPRDLVILARCTPPAWPFPRDIPLDHTMFGTLRRETGKGAKQHPITPLIQTAYQAVKLTPPAWVNDQSLTLRAMLKRSLRNPRRTTHG